MKLWSWDNAAWRYAKRLHGYDGTAWRQIKKAWDWDGAVWRVVHQQATLATLSASRDACNTTSGHILTWTTSGQLTGWTVSVERKIGGGSFSTIATGIDPATGTASYPYVSGNSQTDYTYRVSMVNSPLTSTGSPKTVGPTINAC